MRTGPLAALILILLAPALARAQCAEGRVVTPDTHGRCCWPDQRWSQPNARCEGPPACPTGWIAEGDTCLGSLGDMVAAPPASYGGADGDSSSTPGGRSDATPPSSTDRSWYVRGPVRFEPQLELMWAGVIVGSLGYVFSIVVGAVEATQCCRNSPWPWFVPLAGPVLYPALDGSVFASVLLVAAPASATQLVGLILLLVGGLSRRPVADSPTVGPGPGEVGMSLRWAL